MFSIKFSPSGRELFGGSSDQAVYLFDFETRRRIARVRFVIRFLVSSHHVHCILFCLHTKKLLHILFFCLLVFVFCYLQTDSCTYTRDR